MVICKARWIILVTLKRWKTLACGTDCVIVLRSDWIASKKMKLLAHLLPNKEEMVPR